MIFGIPAQITAVVSPPLREKEKGGDLPMVLCAGLPDITGSFDIRRAGFSTSSGAFYNWSNGNNGWGSGSNDTQTTGHINFAASKSNEIYGKNNTVTPPSLAIIPQIKF